MINDIYRILYQADIVGVWVLDHHQLVVLLHVLHPLRCLREQVFICTYNVHTGHIHFFVFSCSSSFFGGGVDIGFFWPILLFLMWQRQWRCWWCLAKVIHVFPYLCGWMNIHWAALRLHPRLPCWQRGYHQSATWWPWRSWHWTDEVDDDNDTGNFVDDIKFNDDSLTVIFWNAQLSIYKRSRYDVAWCINLII